MRWLAQSDMVVCAFFTPFKQVGDSESRQVWYLNSRPHLQEAKSTVILVLNGFGVEEGESLGGPRHGQL